MTATAPVAAGKPAVLFVDDEPDVLNSLRSLFRRDFQVHQAQTGPAALTLLQQHPIQVVVSDQRMPGMTGTEFLTQVAQGYPDVIRLLMTGFADIDSVIAAINTGNVYRYISKPWDPKDLVLMVKQAVEQHTLLAERRRLLDQLQEANELKSAFISVASHELNTPLTVVLGMLELAEAISTEPGVVELLQRGLGAADRLHRQLINTFKLLEQENFRFALPRVTLDCHAFITDVLKELSPFYEPRGLRFAVTVEPADLTMEVSASHFRDVLLNLFSNAIKFSPDGAQIQVQAARHNGAIDWEIRDPGMGIALPDQPHIFKPLFASLDTTHHSSGTLEFGKRGMGVGLAIVKKFVELHGGTVSFASQPGAGSVFRMTIPSTASLGGSTP